MSAARAGGLLAPLAAPPHRHRAPRQPGPSCASQHLPLPHPKGSGSLPWGELGGFVWSQGRIKAGRTVRGAGPAVGMASSCQRLRGSWSPRQVQRPCGHGFPARSSQEVPGAAGGGAGSLPPGLCWQRHTELIPAPFEHPSDPEAASPPATRWDRAPRRGPRGERFVQVTTSQADQTHAHTHPPTHTTECNRTQCRTSFTHTQSVCARLTRYSTAGTGQPWLGYCTGVNVNNKASSERLRQRPKNSCFVQKCP